MAPKKPISPSMGAPGQSSKKRKTVEEPSESPSVGSDDERRAEAAEAERSKAQAKARAAEKARERRKEKAKKEAIRKRKEDSSSRLEADIRANQAKFVDAQGQAKACDLATPEIYVSTVIRDILQAIEVDPARLPVVAIPEPPPQPEPALLPVPDPTVLQIGPVQPVPVTAPVQSTPPVSDASTLPIQSDQITSAESTEPVQPSTPPDSQGSFAVDPFDAAEAELEREAATARSSPGVTSSSLPSDAFSFQTPPPDFS